VEVRAKIARWEQAGGWRGWRALALALLVLAGGVLVVGLVRVQRATSRPSVLLVSIDTLRADHVGAYGATHAETPQLDALAQSGVLFEQAFAPVPLTLPSHATLLTGLEPPRHGVRHNGIYRLGEAETLAERLADAGYRTGAFVGSFVLAAGTGLSQGFDRYDDTMSRQAFSKGVFLERSAEEVTSAALRWFGETDGPTFAWVHYYDPHLEHRAPAPFAERFPERPYDAEIAYVDQQLGRLVEAFRRRFGGESALVLVTADHGESRGEHGESTHGYTLHDGVLRVPLIVSGAGVPAERRVHEVVGVVDVTPTILSLVGLQPLPGADGRDLSANWAEVPEAAAPGARRIYSETLATKLDHGWAPLYSSRSERWRYVRAPRPELYASDDSSAAPENLLSAAHGNASPAVIQVRAEHEQAIDEVLARGVESRRHEIDAATRKALEALGYAISEAPIAESGIDPKDGMIYLARYTEALQAFSEQRHDDAQRLLEEVIEGSPASADAHSMLSRVLSLEGELERARIHARRATALVPARAHYLAMQGMIELQLGATDAAGAAFERARMRDENVAELQVGLLWLAARDGRLSQALAHERRATELGAGGWEIQQWIGSVWASLGQLDRAQQAFESAAGLAPNELQPRADLALLWVRRGDDQRARQALALAGPAVSTPAFRNRLAIAQAQAGHPERAVATFEELLREVPDYRPARNNLASLRRALDARGSPWIR
jgi:arylsulfatase A-like enzyme/Tfp pilus assembly protein PilF